MRQLEDSVGLVQAIRLRRKGRERIQVGDERQQELDAVEEQIQKRIGEQVGYFTSYSKSKRVEQEVRASFADQIKAVKQKYSDVDTELTQSIVDLVNDFQAIDAGDLEASQREEDLIDFGDLPANYVRFHIDVHMASHSVCLENEFLQRLFDLEVKGFHLGLKMAASFLKLSITVEDIQMVDLWGRSEPWPHVLGTTGDQDEPNTPGQNVLTIQFETNKDFKQCPFHLIVRVDRPVFVVANLPLVQEVVRTISLALQDEKLDFEFFLQLAMSRLAPFKEETKRLAEEIKSGKIAHQSFSVEASLKAPVLKLPLDIFDPEALVATVDLGCIAVNSDLRTFDKAKDYSEVLEESELFDKYTLSLTGLRIHLHDPRVQLAGHPLLDDVAVTLTLSKCLDSLHPVFPSLKVDFQFVEAISLNADITTVVQLLRIKHHLLLQLENKLLMVVRAKMAVHRKKKDYSEDTGKGDDKSTQLTNEDDGLEHSQIELRPSRIDVEDEEGETPGAESLAPRTPAPRVGSNVHIYFALKALRIRFDSQNLYEVREQYNNPMVIQYELSGLSSALKMASDQASFEVVLLVKQLEIQEVQPLPAAGFDKIAFRNDLLGDETQDDSA